MPEDRWARLGRMVDVERARLHLSWAALSRRAGIGSRTLYKIHHGTQAGYDGETLARLEAALWWEWGSIESVLEGGGPTRIADPQMARVRAVWPDLTPAAREAVAATAEAHRPTGGARA